jgi:hypothetical protein
MVRSKIETPRRLIMKLKGFVVSGALFTVALAGLALPASAQNYKAKFTLPFEAHWGAVVLEPGDYTITKSSVSAIPILSVTGNGRTASIIAGPAEVMEPSNGGGRLELTEVNGTHVVTRFYAATAGKDYTFAIPKPLSRNGFGAVALKKAVVPVSN